MNDLFKFDLLEHVIAVDCWHEQAMSLVRANYAAFSRESSNNNLEYQITQGAVPSDFLITRNKNVRFVASDFSELLFFLEKDITIEIQKLRRDLYFLHAAALSIRGKGCLLVAPSGVGKSTTTWALLQDGFDYLSDELAPIDLETFLVAPYPHAICLKQQPPAPYSLPAGYIDVGRTLHIPVNLMPEARLSGPAQLAAIFFLQRNNATPEPKLAAISNALAATQLYANALNPLAHPGEGLDACIKIVRDCKCFQLHLGDLTATSALIRECLDNLNVASEALFR